VAKRAGRPLVCDQLEQGQLLALCARGRRDHSGVAPLSPARSLGARADAGHAGALSFIGVVIALNVVPEGSELPSLHVWI
jgi:hypothetical protein